MAATDEGMTTRKCAMVLPQTIVKIYKLESNGRQICEITAIHNNTTGKHEVLFAIIL